MTRTAVLSDEIWARIEPVLPPGKAPMGSPMRDHRRLVEGAIYRDRTGVAWRDLPSEFGPWQTVWKRHHRFSTDGTRDKVLLAVQAQADAAGEIDWRLSVVSTIAPVHRHGATAARSPLTSTSCTGAGSNDKVTRGRRDEPGDHALGRSRGGLTSKTHAPVDGRGLPLVIACTPGRSNDSPALPRLLAELRIPRIGPGRPRTTPRALPGDEA
jgi:transposase